MGLQKKTVQTAVWRLAQCGVLGVALSAQAADDKFNLIRSLAEEAHIPYDESRFNAYGQITYISSYKPAFPAAYTNFNGSPNSLLPKSEHSFTASATAYFGLKLWQNGEVYLAPEMVSLMPLSELKGLGGSIQNFELQKNGETHATWYVPRFYLKQTFNFGGEEQTVESGPMQLAGSFKSRRLVITGGEFSILDFFDKNSYAADLRQQSLNMAFMTHASYDFAADARGYTTGVVAELYYDDWAFRFARIVTPKEANGLALDYNFFKYYGDQIELEHRHQLQGLPGAVRVLGYRNNENMGNWNDAIAALQRNPANNAANCQRYSYDSLNASAPDLCWARKEQTKLGIGINMEQAVSDDLGLFFRGMISDGETEVYSYTSSDRSLSFGGLLTGQRWGRQQDALGIGYASSWLSAAHVDYLSRGGIDGFIGDGKIKYEPEQVANIYYKARLIPSMWVSLDYQHIWHPAYNADRGPVNIFGARAHVEF
jgi:high affinity Mn2+ porin